MGKPTYQWTNSTIVSLLNTSTIPFIQYLLFGCFGVPFHSPKLPRFTLGSRIVLFLFSVLFFFGDQRNKKWRSREAKNYKSREAGEKQKSKHHRSRKAKKQGNRHPKNKQNGKSIIPKNATVILWYSTVKRQ